jgi:hypothetical protein
MRDLEFILRFLALNQNSILESEKSNISLKKILNEFMGNKINNSTSKILEFEYDFIQTLESVNSQFSDIAFYNVQSNDLTTLRKRFYPTIFDSIMIATSIARKSGVIVNHPNEIARLNLLRDKDYRKYCSEGTMLTEHIKGRVNLALKHLYNIENE